MPTSGFCRHDGAAVSVPFPRADGDLVWVEIDVLDAEAAAFHEPKARAVEELGHQGHRTSELAEQHAHLLSGQHDGQAATSLRHHEAVPGG